MTVKRQLPFLAILALVALALQLPAQEKESPLPRGYRAPRPFNLPFLIRPERWYYASEQGMLMLCPAHAHGNKEEATAELIRLASQHSSPAPATIWVCRVDQLDTLREFAPMVDRVCINPILQDSGRDEARECRSWPGTDHPILNRFRAIRQTAPDRQLIACVNVNGENRRFAERPPTFEEIQWMALAAVGSGFQGIAWRGRTDDLPYRNRLDTFTANILRHATELARAKPVDWVTLTNPENDLAGASSTPKEPSDRAANNPIPYTALRAGNRLFVTLLHPHCMRPQPGATMVDLSLRTLQRDCVVDLHPPAGIAIAGARRIDGVEFTLSHDANRTLVPCHFASGGTLIIFNLESSTQTHSGTANQ